MKDGCLMIVIMTMVAVTMAAAVEEVVVVLMYVCAHKCVYIPCPSLLEQSSNDVDIMASHFVLLKTCRIKKSLT